METNDAVIKMKELLSDPNKRIVLDDFVTGHVKQLIDATSPTHFPAQGSNFQHEDFINRLKKYETAVKDMRSIVILLARWGDKDHIDLLKKIFVRLSENVEREHAGLTVWLHMNWYPLHVLMYVAGISALAAGKFDVLKTVLETPVSGMATQGKHTPLLVPVLVNVSDLTDLFKHLPGKDRHYTPRSEHMFEISREPLEELLFLGKSYDELFDDFEIYSALVFAEVTGRGWGPIGRFGWKYHQRFEINPFDRIVADAEKHGAKWPPLQAGFFQGSLEKFTKVANTFRELLNKLTWW